MKWWFPELLCRRDTDLADREEERDARHVRVCSSYVDRVALTNARAPPDAALLLVC